MRPFRCVKCAGPLKTTYWNIGKNVPALRALCSGQHPVNYKGCQVYKEIRARKMKKTLKRSQNPNKLIDITNNKSEYPPLRKINKKHDPKEEVYMKETQNKIIPAYSEIVNKIETNFKVNTRKDQKTRTDDSI